MGDHLPPALQFVWSLVRPEPWQAIPQYSLLPYTLYKKERSSPFHSYRMEDSERLTAIAQQCEPSANKHWQLAAACAPWTIVARKTAAVESMQIMMVMV
jgi:hypothetical protein